MRALWLVVCIGGVGGVGCGAGPVRATPPPADPDPAAARDPVQSADRVLLRREAGRVMQWLIEALPPDKQARVAGITLDPDPLPGEINAYASCDGAAPYIAVSDDLLLVEAQLAMARATDERFATDTTHELIRWFAERPEQTGQLPPVAFWDPAQHVDREKVSRQRVMFDEQLAYVLGHELAHHTLGHLACTSTGFSDDAMRDVVDAAPIFSQAGEIAADIEGIHDVLAAGRRFGWTEEGALVLFEFFTKWHAYTATDVVLAFERSHPFPILRLPIVMTTADVWRASGGLL